MVLNVPVNNFLVILGRLPGLNQNEKILLKGHNAVPLVRLEPTTLHNGPGSAVGNVSGYRCVSDCRSRGREFDPAPVPYFRGD